MSALYRIAFKSYHDAWFEKGDLFKLIANADDEDLCFFGGFCDDVTAEQTKSWIGGHLAKFTGQKLSGATMEIDGRAKGERQKIQFLATSAKLPPL